MSLINLMCLHHPKDSEKSAIRALGGTELNAIVDKLLAEYSAQHNLTTKEIATKVFQVNPNSIASWRGRNNRYKDGHPVPLWALEKLLTLLQKDHSERIEVVKNIFQIECGRVSRRVNAVTTLDSRLAKLCGAHAADGSLYRQPGRGPITSLWEVGDQEKSNIEAVQEWVSALFGIELPLHKKGAMYFIRTDLQVIPRYLIRVFDFPTGEKSQTVMEPPILSNPMDSRLLEPMDEDRRWSLRLDFAREVVNFDGHSTVTGGIVSVGLGSESAKMRGELSKIFEHFGVKFRNYDLHRKMLTTSEKESRKLYQLGLFRGHRRDKFRISLCQ